jgi:alkylated DNA repair protein (DNA oxidative demethylase)
VKPNREDSGHQAVARCRVPAADRASVGRGNTSRRTVRHLGLRYDYSSRVLRKGEPIPEELVPIMHQAAEFAALREGELVESIVNTGTPSVAALAGTTTRRSTMLSSGVSLGAACTIQFRTEEASERRVFEQLLDPGSACIMRDDVRNSWQHRIPPTKGERVSLTFRSLKQR